MVNCVWLKLQVIFRKRATNSVALLRKITYQDKASSNVYEYHGKLQHTTTIL